MIKNKKMENSKLKRLVNIILITISIIIFLPLNVSADEKADVKQGVDEIQKRLESDERIEGFYNYVNNLELDEEITNGLNIKEYINSYLDKGKSDISLDTVIKIATSYLFKEVKSVVKLLVSIVVLAIITALIKNLQEAFSNESISNIAFFACYAVLILLLSKSFLISLDIAKTVINDITDFMAVLLPVLVFLMSTAGGVTSAVTMDPIVLGAVHITPKIYTDFIFPLILMYFVMQFANNLSEHYKIDGLCKLVKQVALWSQGLILTAFVALLTIRGISSNAIDAVTLKTAKFAVDNFVPIVGKAFSDAITTVAGYSLLLKNAISSIGLIVVILIVLYPVIKLVVIAFAYKLASAIVEPIVDKRMVNAISSAAECLIMILACVISLSVMFFIMVSIMATAGKFVVGG